MKSINNVTLRSIPLIRLLVPFIGGIYLGSIISDFEISWMVSLLPLFIVCLYFLHKRKSTLYFGLVCYITITLLGVLIIDQNDDRIDSQVPTALVSVPIRYKATLQDDLSKQSGKQWVSINLKIDSFLSQRGWLKLSFPIQAIIQTKDTISKISYGSEISFRGSLDTIATNRNPYAFDYQQFLFRKGMTHQVFIAKDDWKITDKQNGSLYASAKKLQNRLAGILAKYIDEPKNLGIAIAMILGNKDFIPSALYDAYRQTGSAHIMAVSGLHVGIIVFIVMILLKPMRTRTLWSKMLKAISIITILTCYAFVTGLSISVVRATFMYTSVILIYLLSHQKNIWNTLAGVAFIILIIQPQQLFQIGFQFSFLAIIGIMLFNPLLAQYIKSDNRIIKYALSLITVSISAQALLWPLIIYYFNMFSFGFLLTSLLIIPAAFLIISIGIILLLVDFISPAVGTLVAALLNSILSATNGFVSSVQLLSPISYERIWMSTAILIMSYITMMLLFKVMNTFSKLRLYSLLLTINIMLISVAVQIYDRNHKAYVVIYEHPKEMIIDLIHDRICYFLSSKPNIDTEFLVSSNRIRHGVKEVITLNLEADYQDRQLQKSGHHIQFHGIVIDLQALINTSRKRPKQLTINNQKLDNVDHWVVSHSCSATIIDRASLCHSISQSGPKIFMADL